MGDYSSRPEGIDALVERFQKIERQINAMRGARVGPRYGSGSPEGVVVGSPGDFYIDRDGGAGATFYVKETGVGTDTGWDAK